MSTPWVFSHGLNYNDSNEFTVDELMGKGRPALYGKGFKLRKEVAESLNQLIAAAKKEGFSPYVISSYRNYNHQKRIWDNKYVNFTQQQKLSPTAAIEKIIMYSTIPGTSRHHWGTDFDIVDGAKGIVDNPLHEKHFNKNGVYHDFKLWLNLYASSFGFHEVYTNDPKRKGFKYEPWHFSYIPTSCEMLKEYMEKNLIRNVLTSDIQGAAHLTADFLNKYYVENILDINKDLIP